MSDVQIYCTLVESISLLSYLLYYSANYYAPLIKHINLFLYEYIIRDLRAMI